MSQKTFVFVLSLSVAPHYSARIRTKRNSISFSLVSEPKYPECSKIEASYQLYIESYGQLVRSGVTTHNPGKLTDLDCDTYRLHLTTEETGLDYWESVKIHSPCKLFLFVSCFLLFLRRLFSWLNYCRQSILSVFIFVFLFIITSHRHIQYKCLRYQNEAFKSPLDKFIFVLPRGPGRKLYTIKWKK